MASSRVPTDQVELRKMLQDLFINPNLLPPSLLSFLNDYNALNQPPVPASNIIGISGFVELLDANTDTVSINTVNTTAIYSYQVPPGVLQTKGALRVEAAGTILNNTGSSRDMIVTVKYGATTLWQDTSGLIGTSTNTYGWKIDFLFGNNGAADDQKMNGRFAISGAGPATVGFGDFGVNESVTCIFGGSSSENSSLKKELLVTVRLGFGSVNFVFTKDFSFTNRISH